MARLLIIEDNPRQARVAADLAVRAGFSDLQALASSVLAVTRLSNEIKDRNSLPDGIILDLDLGVESGFEVLRFVHQNRLMHRIQVIVWTVMGQHEREICSLFGVEEYVSKHDGPDALLVALKRILPVDSSLPAVG